MQNVVLRLHLQVYLLNEEFDSLSICEDLKDKNHEKTSNLIKYLRDKHVARKSIMKSTN